MVGVKDQLQYDLRKNYSECQDIPAQSEFNQVARILLTQHQS